MKGYHSDAARTYGVGEYFRRSKKTDQDNKAMFL